MNQIRLLIPGLAAVLLLLLLPPRPVQAQEVRLTGGYGGAENSDLIGGFGWGIGIRYFHWAGLGFGIESDRFSRTFDITETSCADDGLGCLQEPVAYDTDTNTTSFILLLGLAPNDAVQIRVGAGRTAGVLRSHGIGRTSGRDYEVPDSDRGSGPLAWSRGADGHVLFFEGVVDLPGPISAFAAYRRHDVRMEGCGEGGTTFLCGPLNHWELNTGLHLHLFPRRDEP